MQSEDKIQVVLVDDHTLFRNGLKMLLNNLDYIEVQAEASDGEEFLNKLPNLQPDVVLMDISMPKMDGIEATHKALEINPQLKILALSMFGEEDYYYKMINAGARGFLLKNSEINEVSEAITKVYKGDSYFSQELLYNVIKNINTQKEIETVTTNLSKREHQVLEQICLGLSNQEIADVLFISKRTVDKHRANLLSKTNSKNTANLIMYSVRHKLIQI
jgi:DNA-binding NarL/FixJ family response regulator